MLIDKEKAMISLIIINMPLLSQLVLNTETLDKRDESVLKHVICMGETPEDRKRGPNEIRALRKLVREERSTLRETIIWITRHCWEIAKESLEDLEGLTSEVLQDQLLMYTFADLIPDEALLEFFLRELEMSINNEDERLEEYFALLLEP